MAVTTSVKKGTALALLAAVTTGTSIAAAIPPDCFNSFFEVICAGTISTGTLILEECASDPAYSGTWSQLLSVDLTALTGGKEQIIHIMGGMKFVRARLSVNVTGAGGSVSVNLYGA